MTTDVLVRIRGLTKNYQRGAEVVHVLDKLDLDVPRGAFLALMGPSGSGKSTLLNLIGGLDRPTQGTIEVAGLRIDSLPEGKLARWRADNVGFIFQMYNLLPALTAERNVELPLLLTKLDRAGRRKRVAAALTLVALSDRARHRPRELSGGQEQRVGIARAIVAKPALLIADEPTGNLDPDSSAHIMALLVKANEAGATVLVATHDPAIVNSLRRRVIALRHGQVFRDTAEGGYPDDLERD
jgi:putative ABC transport system ATP-binding protein